MGKLRVEAQSAASRIDAKTGVKTPDPVVVNADEPGPLRLAADYNLIAPDPHDSTCLPDLLEFGDTLRGKTAYKLIGDSDPVREGTNDVLHQLDSGAHQDVSDGVITYGFYDFIRALGINNNPKYAGEGKGYTPFTQEQIDAARIAIGNWDELISAEFQEVDYDSKGATDWVRNSADIWLANTFTGPAQAWAYYPGQGKPFDHASGDVWIADPRFNASNAEVWPGGYGLDTLNHELGHSLGLSHPGAYNFGDDPDITYDDDAEYAQDTHQYSIMSYFDSFEGGNNVVDWNFMRIVYPSTPMVHDVFVIQYIYGVETDTRADSTTYGFHATADVTNEAMRFEEGEMATVFTIWDAGGEEDTLDLSGYYTPSVIDLREGGYSSAGGFGAYGGAYLGVDPRTIDEADYMAYVNANNVAEGLPERGARYDLYFTGRDGVNEDIPWGETMGWDFLMENNIGIAYGAIIENAIGGEGNDRINGNQVDNEFTGNGGADTFIIADYSGDIVRPGLTGGSVTVSIDDESVDTIMDFDSAEGDKISLCTLGVDYGDLTLDTTVAGQTTVTVDRGDDDLTFIVIGSSLVEGDFIFG